MVVWRHPCCPRAARPDRELVRPRTFEVELGREVERLADPAETSGDAEAGEHCGLGDRRGRSRWRGNVTGTWMLRGFLPRCEAASQNGMPCRRLITPRRFSGSTSSRPRRAGAERDSDHEQDQSADTTAAHEQDGRDGARKGESRGGEGDGIPFAEEEWLGVSSKAANTGRYVFGSRRRKSKMTVRPGSTPVLKVDQETGRLRGGGRQQRPETCRWPAASPDSAACFVHTALGVVGVDASKPRTITFCWNERACNRQRSQEG